MKKFFAYISFLFIFLFPIILLNIYAILTFKNYAIFLISEVILLEIFLIFFSFSKNLKRRLNMLLLYFPSLFAI